ncbi:MAG: dTDP-4-dehydrorhamnose reductase [Alphaproteobacteria bacterium]|nr:dTDP-4-dehydrorhamnose reductase [Alphaproteobacteria bacterium]
MRVLVAGWHGQVAMALSEAAARRADVEAYAVGRPALDLTDRPSIGRTLFGVAPDVIINTAAYTDVEGAEREPHIAFRRNTEGSAALARQAARIGVPVIHLSTVYVFDGSKSAPYAETDPTNPVNAYGRSKRDGETAVVAANPRHIILRTGWIYSPFNRNFVSSLIERAKTGDELRIDSEQRGSPTYAPHLATAILDIAATVTSQPADRLWGTYHIADRGEARWCDLAREALANTRHQSRITAITETPTVAATAGRAPRPRNATLDCAKLERTFGIALPPWQQAVADCVNRLEREPAASPHSA